MSWTDGILKFVNDLGVDDDRLPLERVMRRHIGIFIDLIAAGRTWPQIASAMTRAGARHKRGQPIDPKQLRTVYRRIVKAQSARNISAPMSRDVRHGSDKHQSPDLTVPPAPTSPVGAGGASRSSVTTTQSSDIMSRLAEVKASRSAIKRDFEE